MVQDEDVLIAFLVLLHRVFRRHPVLRIALGIEARHVDLGLALHHHLREVIAGATRRRDAKGKALGQP